MVGFVGGGGHPPPPPPPPGPLTADVRVPPQISPVTLIDNFSLPCVCFVVYIYYNKDTVTVFKRQTLALVWQGRQGISLLQSLRKGAPVKPYDNVTVLVIYCLYILLC